MASLTPFSTLVSMDSSPKIVVVGAGLAGLTTAHYLFKEGKNVEVYEARGRVGGRVFSAFIQDKIGELGGHNITDGGEAEHLRALIQEFNLSIRKCHLSLNQPYFDGETFWNINDLLTEKNYEPDKLQAQLEEIAKDAQNMKEVLDALLSEDDPLYHIVTAKLEGYEGGSIEKLSTFYIETLYHNLRGGISAAHQENTVQLESIEGGNGRLVEKMGKRLENRLHLSMPLKHLTKEGEKYQLTFENGEVVHADIVVLAIPCSVYQAIEINEKVIDKKRLQEIQEVRYGTAGKILVPLREMPESGALDEKGAYFFDASQQILTAYFRNEASFFTEETLETPYYHLNALFGKMGHQMFDAPTYARDLSFQQYETPVAYSWSLDPYVKGTYSYIYLNQEKKLTELVEEKGVMYKALFAPIDDGLYFAGEHASIETAIAGTMEAAVESGKRVAGALLGRSLL